MPIYCQLDPEEQSSDNLNQLQTHFLAKMQMEMYPKIIGHFDLVSVR